MRRSHFRAFGPTVSVGFWLLCTPVASEPARTAIPDPEIAGYVAVEGGRVWYRINGVEHFAEGKMPLARDPWGAGLPHHYLLTLTDLADERPVILSDQLDSGRIGPTRRPTNWTVETFVDEVDHVRNASGRPGGRAR